MVDRRNFVGNTNLHPITVGGVHVGAVAPNGKVYGSQQFHQLPPIQQHALASAALLQSRVQQRPPGRRDNVIDITPSSRVGVDSGYQQKRASIFFPDPAAADLQLLLTSPAQYIDVDYPIEDYLAFQRSFEYLKASATESAGSATASLAPTAQYASLVHAIEVTMQQSTLKGPQGGGTLTITFAPWERNALNVGDGWVADAAGATTGASEVVTDAEMSIDFTMPADGAQRRFYALFCHRVARLGRTLPTYAMLRTAKVQAGKTIAAPATISAAFTNLAAGSEFQAIVTACTPGTPQYDRLLSILPNTFGYGGEAG
jgi:hypothetical protein